MTDPFRPDSAGSPGWTPWAPREAGSAPPMPTHPPVRPEPAFAPGAGFGSPSVHPPAGPPYGGPAQPFGSPPAPRPPVPAPAPGQGSRAMAALIGAVVGAIVAALIAALVVANVDTRSSSGAASPTTAPTPVSLGGGSSSGAAATGGVDVHAVLTAAEPSVVSVQTNLGEGSGFVLSADGYVLTNFHVIEGASSVRVRFADSSTLAAQTIGSFPDNDVALLKVTPTSSLVPARLGSSGALRVGDPVLAIGNALGLGAAPSVTLGIVSALDRSVPINGSVLQHMIQTDAAINHGNSGGPLVNAGGEVVGINTIVADGAQSIGFALSIDSLKPLIEQLKAGKGELNPNTAFLGVSSIAVDDPSVTQQQLDDDGVTSPFGALVVDVTSGSPADKAGLQAGDVIVGIDGKEIRSAADVGVAVRARKAGDPVQLVYERRGKRITQRVVLGRRGR